MCTNPKNEGNPWKLWEMDVQIESLTYMVNFQNLECFKQIPQVWLSRVSG